MRLVRGAFACGNRTGMRQRHEDVWVDWDRGGSLGAKGGYTVPATYSVLVRGLDLIEIAILHMRVQGFSGFSTVKPQPKLPGVPVLPLRTRPPIAVRGRLNTIMPVTASARLPLAGHSYCKLTHYAQSQ